MGTREPAVDFALASDWPEVAALCAATSRAAPFEYFLNRLREDPTILPEGVLVTRSEGRIVSTVTAHLLAMRYGTAELPVLGIANVATAQEFRGRGLARGLLAAAHQLAAARHVPLALLSTEIPAFYDPLGYHPWERRITSLLGWAASPPGPAAGTVRPLDGVGDAAALADLHAAAGRGLAGPLVRTAEMLRRLPRWSHHYPGEEPALALAASAAPGGPVRACLRGRTDPASGWAEVLDFAVAADAPQLIPDLASAFVAASAARGAKGIRLPAGCRALETAFAPFVGAAVEATDRSLLLAILNPTGLLAAILPELTARAGAARLRDGRLGLDVAGTLLRLEVREGTVALDRPARLPADLPLAALPTPLWLEVLMGVRPFSAQPFAAGSTLGERELNLLDALFPRRASLFWGLDLF